MPPDRRRTVPSGITDALGELGLSDRIPDSLIRDSPHVIHDGFSYLYDVQVTGRDLAGGRGDVQVRTIRSSRLMTPGEVFDAVREQEDSLGAGADYQMRIDELDLIGVFRR